MVIISDYYRGSQCIFSLMVVAVHDTLGHDVVLSYIVLCMGGSKKQSVLTVARMLYEKLLSIVLCCQTAVFPLYSDGNKGLVNSMHVPLLFSDL